MDLPPAPPSPTPAPGDARPYWKRALAVYLPWAVSLIMSFVATWLAAQPAKVEVQKVEVPIPVVWQGEPDRPFIAGGGGATHPTYGWVRHEETIAANLDPVLTQHFADTPAGKVVQGDMDTFLWRAVRKAGGFPDNQYPSLDQGQVGCCVGCGWADAANVCLAVQVVSVNKEEWHSVSPEAIYALSRVEARPPGASPIHGDGSVGAWAANAVTKFGLLAQQKYTHIDLSTFSPSRARSWGKSGLPNDLEPIAKEHPVKGSALVKTWGDVKKAIQQGYPIAVCSDQGFTMTRDASGTCRPSGTWGHCMAIIGCRTLNGKEQGFILNSWGDNAHTGPCVPADAPPAGFWADASTINRMVAEGDSFALSDAVGFAARQVPLDWGLGVVVPKVQARPLFAQLPPVLAW